MNVLFLILKSLKVHEIADSYMLALVVRSGCFVYCSDAHMKDENQVAFKMVATFTYK
jgi:hypothetical protein